MLKKLQIVKNLMQNHNYFKYRTVYLVNNTLFYEPNKSIFLIVFNSCNCLYTESLCSKCFYVPYEKLNNRLYHDFRQLCFFLVSAASFRLFLFPVSIMDELIFSKTETSVDEVSPAMLAAA